MITFDGFRKRDGLVVPFDQTKIGKAVARAVREIYGEEGAYPESTLNTVLSILDTEVLPDTGGHRIPTLEQVQAAVITALYRENLAIVAEAYKEYKDKRDKARKRIQVHNRKKVGNNNVTDSSLLLVSDTEFITDVWDRSRIIDKLSQHTDLSDEQKVIIAKRAENRIIDSGMFIVSTSFVRELVNNILLEEGKVDKLEDMSTYTVSDEFIWDLMNTKSEENSNVSNNSPETVSMNISGLVLKEWALNNVFDASVGEAHRSGAIHLHDLDYPTRVYCSSHSIPYIAKYGLVGLLNLSTESGPAKSASVLTGHLNTFLASMQANYAGALGLGFINVFYAPYLTGKSFSDHYQIAQELIFNGSQNAFSRGGQVLFLDFNVHFSVPQSLKDVPAICPGGKYKARNRITGMEVELQEHFLEDKDGNGNSLTCLSTGGRIIHKERWSAKKGYWYDEDTAQTAERMGWKVLTYGDFEKEAQRFAEALMQVWGDGDKNGRIFPFPKFNAHVDNDVYTNPESYRLFQKACEVSSTNGSTYFIFDRDAVTMAACCRLRTTIEDKRFLLHPETMSFCGFQNVTINIPQAAYLAKEEATKKGKDVWEVFLQTLSDRMSLAVKAHLQKKQFISTIMNKPGQPLYQIGKVAAHGKPYVDLDKATYIIGLIGLNDALDFLKGKELHEDREMLRAGLEVITHMYLKTKTLGARHGMKITLEESPAESAARRLAQTDLRLFPETAHKYVKGDSGAEYYTNSIHIRADADVDIVERIRKQSVFHSLIESGAIIHAFVGEKKPSPEAIEKLVTKTYDETQCAQLTISPEFTYCNSCNGNYRGLQDQCPSCGCINVDHLTRVVGYFSKVQNWNKSKRYGELIDRQAGNYGV